MKIHNIMEINIDRIRTTIKVDGSIPIKVLLAFLRSEWSKQEYEGLFFPFEQLTYNSYKLVKPWKLLDDTLNNIHGAGISTE